MLWHRSERNVFLQCTGGSQYSDVLWLRLIDPLLFCSQNLYRCTDSGLELVSSITGCHLDWLYIHSLLLIHLIFNCQTILQYENSTPIYEMLSFKKIKTKPQIWLFCLCRFISRICTVYPFTPAQRGTTVCIIDDLIDASAPGLSSHHISSTLRAFHRWSGGREAPRAPIRTRPGTWS